MSIIERVSSGEGCPLRGVPLYTQVDPKGVFVSFLVWLNLYITEILHWIDNLVFHHATLFQLLTPPAPLWYHLGEELGLTTYLEKIEVNNMESCLKAMLYVWEEQSQKRFYS